MDKLELERKCKELQKHQGWANYETWVVNLWITNDWSSFQSMQAFAKDIAIKAQKDSNVIKGIWTAAEAAKFNLADYIKKYLSDEDPLIDYKYRAKWGGLYGDILRGALKDVDYEEIAGSLLEGITIPEPGIPSHSSTEPGKFESSGDIGKKLHAITMESGQDDQLGDVEDFGWYALIIDTGISEVPHAIVNEDHDGFFDYTSYDTEKEAREEWDKLEHEYGDFMVASGQMED